MNVNQAAGAAGVSRRSIYNWMAAGTLPYTTKGRSRHVEIEDVLKLAEQKPRAKMCGQEVVGSVESGCG